LRRSLRILSQMVDKCARGVPVAGCVFFFSAMLRAAA
jgi:hypothetical protein